MKNVLFIFLMLCASCKDEVIPEVIPDECINPNRWEVISGCYKIYDPVCGCNNVTYGNDCEAKVAGVVRWTKGKCPQ